MAEGQKYYHATGFAVSENNMLLAYAVDNVSRRQYTIYIKNLITGKLLKDTIANTTGDHCWANDNRTLFYTSKNPVTLLSEKIFRHSLNTNSSSDVVVYNESDNTNYIGVTKSRNRKYIMIYSNATLSSEIRILDASVPSGTFRVFQPRMKEVLYHVIPLADKFLIRTSKDNAKNFKLMECPLGRTGADNWKEIIPERADVFLEDVEEFKDFLCLRKESRDCFSC